MIPTITLDLLIKPDQITRTGRIFTKKAFDETFPKYEERIRTGTMYAIGTKLS